jgi:hypothetical protein
MNVGNVGSGGSQFLSLESDSIPEGSFTSVSGKLAVLMLNSQEQQKQAQHEQLDSARRDFTEALNDEVQALKDGADAAFRGALFAGATAIASGGMGVWAAGRDCEKPWQQAVGDGLGKLSEPLGAAVGKNYGAADAKSAQGAEEVAKWQLQDAHDSIKAADDLQKKALDWASSMSDRDAATTTAILSNKV